MKLQVIAIQLLPVFISFQNTYTDSNIKNKANPSVFIKLPFYEPKRCGELTFPQEIGNGLTKIGEYPWVVAIANYYAGSRDFCFECSGVLISSWHVLTQLNCVTGIDITFPQYIQIGDWNLIAKMDCENNVCSDSTQFIPVDKIFTRYGPTYKWVDNIGVIKLARSVQFTRYVAPICLPNKHSNPYVTGTQFVVCGWSRSTNDDYFSEIKRKRLVNVDSDEICENDEHYRTHYDRSEHFCSNKTLACTGDGPVMGIDTSDSNNPYWYIAGFFLFNHKCKESPAIFVKVLPYLEWIQDRMLID